MDLRRVAGGGLLALLAVVGVWSGGPAFLPGTDGGTIQALSVEEVVLNDELAGDVPTGEGGAGVCAGGPPPDHFAVELKVTVADTESGRFVDSESYRIVIRIGAHTSAREVTVTDGGRKRIEAFPFVRDDDSVAPGEQVSVTVSLRREGETIESLTRTVPVQGRDPDCVTTGDS